MDAVVLISLGVTLLILSDLEEIQNRFLIRARLPELQNDLVDKASKISDILDSSSDLEESREDLERALSEAQGILKQIQNRTEDVDRDTHMRAGSLHDAIDKYRKSKPTAAPGRHEADKLYDLWGEMHTVSELTAGVIKESKWTR